MAYAIKNILINRIHDNAVIDCATRNLSGRLIDIGCGAKPYAAALALHVQDHIGVDHPITPHGQAAVDLIGTAYQIPVEAESFDAALCTAVLEHLEEPESAIRECYRVLKPGGKAVYSVPFIWHLHEEPRDFFRYSKYGLQYLFQKGGFQIVELKPLSGFFTTFGALLSYYVCRFNRGPLRWLRLIDLACLSIQGMAWMLDTISRDERYTWMYVIVVQKPAAAARRAAA